MDSQLYCEYHVKTGMAYNATAYPALKPLNATDDETQNVTESDGAGLYPEIERILLTRVVIAICAFGVFGNVLTLGLLIHRKWLHRKRKFADSSVARANILGLISLAVSDLCFCLSVLPHVATDLNQYTHDSPSFALYFSLVENCLINTFVMTSTWLTVVMTVNRYAHLCHPMLGLRYFGSRFTSVSLLLSTVFSVLFNLPRFWGHEIRSVQCYDSRTLEVFPVHGLARGSLEDYRLAYEWVYFFIGILIPLCVLAYCNCRIIHAVYNSKAVEQRRNKERNVITKILICIVICYLLLVSPAEIVKFLPRLVAISTTRAVNRFNFVVTIFNTLQAVNFSCNFIPYLVLDKKFRYQLAFLSCGRKPSMTSYAPSRRLGSRYESVTGTTNIAESVTMEQFFKGSEKRMRQMSLHKQYD